MYFYNLVLLFGLCRASSHLNKRSEEFVIDRNNFPYVPFDIGESYGGLLPVSSNPNDTQKLYFWFSPSENPAASNDITIWLNGGPGCSSLIGLLQENGNFLWQAGTTQPVANPWAWTKLTNMVWIDQPVGAGFSQGEPTAYGSDDTAEQFLGFWKNFMETFNLTNREVYITGESYAGVSESGDESTTAKFRQSADESRTRNTFLTSRRRCWTRTTRNTLTSKEPCSLIQP